MLSRTCDVRIAVLSCALPLLLVFGASGDEMRDKKQFKGVKAVAVKVGGPSKEPKGLATDRLTTEIEIQVRKAGLRVLPDARKAKEDGKREYTGEEVMLWVQLTRAIDLHDLIGPPPAAVALPREYVYDYEVFISEYVLIQRPHGYVVKVAKTWWRHGQGLDHAATIRDDIRASVNEFINQWLKDNER